MGEVHPLHIFHEVMGQFHIGKELTLGVPPPRSQMYFIYGKGTIQGIPFLPGGHPFPILPIMGGIPNYGCGVGGMFATFRKRIRFLGHYPVVIGVYTILIEGALPHCGYKTFPDTTAVPTNIKTVIALVPMVKIPYYGNRSGRRGPNGKISSLYSIELHRMGA